MFIQTGPQLNAASSVYRREPEVVAALNLLRTPEETRHSAFEPSLQQSLINKPGFVMQITSMPTP
jgi:hypothetical protein